MMKARLPCITALAPTSSLVSRMTPAGPILFIRRHIACSDGWGVTVVFGMPGDGINGIMEALRQRQDRVRFVQVRHEESAAFMACAYARFTGKLGVCLATS